jgi:hypothetical protein
MARLRGPRSVQVSLNLHFLEISGTWEPNDNERRAAWELHVELVTRIAVVPLGADDGVLREALSSLYTLFATTREILRKYGPDIAEPKPDGQYNFGVLAVSMLNYALRPVLARWHPALEEWEAERPPGRSRAEHELAWNRAQELRGALNEARAALSDYARIMADACGVPDLIAATRLDVASDT